MKILIGGKVRKARLTTDHAASSYGLPVLMVDGDALSQTDIAASHIWLVQATQREREELRQARYYIPDEPWGLRLARLRKAAGLTQSQLAEQVGLHQSIIAELEGRHSPPNSVKVLNALRSIISDL